MKNKLNNFISDMGAAYNYFLHNPDKTQVIIQFYFLNHLFRIQETSLFWFVDKCRILCLKFRDD